MKITNEQTRAVASMLIDAAATSLEFYTEKIRDGLLSECKDVPYEVAQFLISHWLKNLPGDAWNNGLLPYAEVKK